jgi:hypothetical protein
VCTGRAHIHHHIQHLALGSAHQLVMSRFAHLEMHTPDHTGLGAGEKRLGWAERQTQGRQGTAMEQFDEVATIVVAMRALQEGDSRQSLINDFEFSHEYLSSQNPESPQSPHATSTA